MGGENDNLLEQHPELAYPNTDGQYSQPQQVLQTASGKVMTEDEYISQYYESSTSSSNSAGQQTATIQHSRIDEEKGESKSANPSSTSAWEEFVDDETGATYYYNEATGESSWNSPST